MNASLKLTERRPERPLPLVRQASAAEDFPVHALGHMLGAAARAVQDHVQSPIAMCGQSVLAAATLVVQGHADVELPTGQVKPLSNFFVTVAASGERKSATDGLALRPVRKHEEMLGMSHAAELPAYHDDRDAWDAARKKVIQKGKGDRAAIKDALKELGPEPLPPLHPMLTCPEPTFEGLCRAFQFGQPSLGIFSAEGAQFLSGHGMSPDNKMVSAAGLSGLWDGEVIKRVRVAEGVVIIPGRRLSLHLMVQPGVAGLMLSDAQLLDQGLLSRCLVVAPNSTAGRRFFREVQPESVRALLAYESRLHEILQLHPPLADGSRNVLLPRILSLDEEATALWRGFADDVERKLGPNGPFEPIAGLANKLPEHAARLAGVLTLVGQITAREINGEDMARGIVLAQYYAGEALRLFACARIDADLQLALRLLDWLHHSWPEDLVSLPDAYQRGLNAVGDRRTAARLIKILQTHGWLEVVPGGGIVRGENRRHVWRIVRGHDHE